MDLGIAGKNAIIAASSAGLGFACAESLAKEGANVVINGRDQDRLNTAAEKLRLIAKGTVTIVVGDIALDETRAALLQACPHPDILITNNGGPPPGRFQDWGRDNWLSAVDSNMLAPLLLIRDVLDGMVERKFGRIINITSAMTKSPLSPMGLSSAARTGLMSVAVVVKNFAARTARAGVGHHPKVVALVTPALVVANADDPLGRQTNFFGPNVVGLVVFLVDGGEQALFGQLVNLGEQLPSPFQAFTLEVVAKGPVAQHLKKGVVAGGIAHVFQIVVLTARAQTGLHRGCAHIRALVRAQKHVFELHHPGIGEHQCGVVARHQRAGGDHGVAFGGKKV